MNLMENIRKSSITKSIQILPIRERRRIFAVVVIQILMGFLDLLGVLIVGVIGSLAINGVQSKGPGERVSRVLELMQISDLSFQKQVAILGLVASALLISRTIFSAIIIRKTIYFLSRRSSALSSHLIRKLLAQDILFVRKKTTQETLFALTTGATAITTGVIGSSVSLIADLSLLIVLATGLLFLDISIAVSTFLLFGTVGVFLYHFLHTKAAALGEASTKLTIESNEKLLQVLDSYREMIVRGRRFYFASEISKIRYQISDVSAELAFMPNVSKYTIEAATVLGVLLISASQFLLQDASHAVATLSVFLIAGARIAPAILRMQQGAIQIRSSLAVAKPTLEFIDGLMELDEIQDPGDKIDFLHLGFISTVKVKNISFSYANGNSPTISNLSINIEQGEQTAIVGTSGAGKTTLVDLLLGIVSPTIGIVEISGITPTEAIKTWPGAISYVPQDISLVSGSILENIVLGYPVDSVNINYVQRAVELSNLSKFISTLPLGLAHQVGEHGDRLSGGQRQRVALARALYSNPKILILDEATSSLDAESEAEISESIKGLRGEITVIMIAHRLSTVRAADQVLYLEEGKVIARGKFEDIRNQVEKFDRQAFLMGL
jgi:ABC-type multidrug transport system fused ATPase/permease subunit